MCRRHNTFSSLELDVFVMLKLFVLAGSNNQTSSYLTLICNIDREADDKCTLHDTSSDDAYVNKAGAAGQ